MHQNKYLHRTHSSLLTIFFKQFQMKQAKYALDNWQFTFHEAGLSSSQQIEQVATDCKLFRAPTIVFCNNQCIIQESKAEISLTFNAKHALEFINYQKRQQSFVPANGQSHSNSISYIPEKLYVKHAQHWKSIQKPKDIQITEIKESSDSFFLNSFKGHLEGKVKIQKVKENVIPLQKLGPSNPITFYHQGSMYEDQLDDNGLIQYEYKFRTMADSWFGLIRNYARIDEVAVLIYDTRIYWEKSWNKIGRQFMVKRSSWEELKSKFEFPMGWTMNPNQSHLVYQSLNEVFVENEYIHFG